METTSSPIFAGLDSEPICLPSHAALSDICCYLVIRLSTTVKYNEP